VLKYTLDGTEVFRIGPPDIDVYANGAFSPAQVAVDEKRHGGNGNIWVATPTVRCLSCMSTSTGSCSRCSPATRASDAISHPHAVFIDRHRDVPELFVTDRRNKRIQVYTLEGEFLRSFGDDFFLTLSGFAQRGPYLFVIELDSRITILDRDNAPIGFLGADGGRSTGWPNTLGAEGKPTRPQLDAGRFHTPHAARRSVRLGGRPVPRGVADRRMPRAAASSVGARGR